MNQGQEKKRKWNNLFFKWGIVIIAKENPIPIPQIFGSHMPRNVGHTQDESQRGARKTNSININILSRHLEYYLLSLDI